MNREIEAQIESLDLTAPAPTEEPLRQYYFMGKARQYTERLKETLQRTPTFHVTTFGCQMNARDSEKFGEPGILARNCSE